MGVDGAGVDVDDVEAAELEAGVVAAPVSPDDVEAVSDDAAGVDADFSAPPLRT